jgi:hypothetical protein
MKIGVVLGGLLGVTIFATGCGMGFTSRSAATPVGTTIMTSAELSTILEAPLTLDNSDPWGKQSRALDSSDPWTSEPAPAVAPVAPAARTWGVDNDAK